MEIFGQISVVKIKFIWNVPVAKKDLHERYIIFLTHWKKNTAITYEHPFP